MWCHISNAASHHLKLPETQLFDQELVQANKENIKASALLVLHDGNPQMTGVLSLQMASRTKRKHLM